MIVGFFFILVVVWFKMFFGFILVRLMRIDGFFKRLVWFVIWIINIFIVGSCII